MADVAMIPPNEDDKVDKGNVSPFLALADEIIDCILMCKRLDHRDVCRFAAVCRRFNAVATANELWRKKSFQRFVTFILIVCFFDLLILTYYLLFRN